MISWTHITLEVAAWFARQKLVGYNSLHFIKNTCCHLMLIYLMEPKWSTCQAWGHFLNQLRQAHSVVLTIQLFVILFAWWINPRWSPGGVVLLGRASGQDHVPRRGLRHPGLHRARPGRNPGVPLVEGVRAKRCIRGSISFRHQTLCSGKHLLLFKSLKHCPCS